MSFIRTVIGDIAPAELGVCYAHEHVIIDPCYMTEKHPDFQIGSVDRAVEELLRFKEDGGRAMIDSMPSGGRNPVKLAEVSRRSGVHLVCPTGLHLAKYYPPGHWMERLDAEGCAALFCDEIEIGIDANDLNGPDRQPLPIRAGLIKVASSERWGRREEVLFDAAAIAHRTTGAPILTHTEQGELALEQIASLQRHGANLDHVVLSHTDRKPDIGYHREILSTGVKVEYDSAFRWKSGNPTRELIETLFAEHPHQLMLGMDAARAGYWKSYGGGPGLSFLLKAFPLPPEVFAAIFIVNPAQAYRFCA